MIKAHELIQNNQLPDKENGLYCLIGRAENGEVHFCDITQAPHILVSGYSGSGKSIFLRGVVLSLIMNYSPDEVGLVLLDTKHHAEFVIYNKTPHFLGEELATAEAELDRRLSSKSSFKNQKKIVVIIDEYAELSRNRRDRKAVEKLVQHGHGVGIHVIVATQGVTKDVITPTLKENLKTVVSCALAEKVDSQFALGKSGAEKLLGKGDMLYKDGSGNTVRVQSGYVSNRDVQEIIQRLKERYESRNGKSST